MASSSKKLVPYILEGAYFEIVTTEETGKIKAKCLPCLSLNKEHIISGSVSATSNFVTHLKRKHSKEFENYEKEAHDPEIVAKRRKQSVLPFEVTVVSASKTANERRLVKFIVDTMSPLEIVENESFRDYSKGLNPDAPLMAKQTLRKRINGEFLAMKEKICKSLEKAKWICITTDIWSARNRSFIGVTAHWLNETLDRDSVILCLKRFPGTHSHDRIAAILMDLFEEYRITNKVVAVVTDNGSNFVAAFKEYGLQVSVVDMEETDDHSADLPEIVEPENLSASLPPHLRCVAHTLSLIATKDLEKVSESIRQTEGPEYKRILRSAFAKTSALWNKIGRSPKVAETIKLVNGKSLVRPVVTRWNSLFDAINSLIDAKSHLDELYAVAGEEPLIEAEVEFLEEYVYAMSPLAKTLDMLQTEKGFYYGYLGALFFNMRNNLVKIGNEEKRYAPHVAKEILRGLENRFKGLFKLDIEKAKTEILATCSMPCFKLRWVPSEHTDNVKKLFMAEIHNFYTKFVNKSNDTKVCETSKWDEMFGDDGKTDDVNDAKAELEAIQFLNDKDRSMSSLDRYPIIREFFVKINTPLASSAPAERLFSYGGMILSPKRNRIFLRPLRMACFVET